MIAEYAKYSLGGLIASLLTVFACIDYSDNDHALRLHNMQTQESKETGCRLQSKDDINLVVLPNT